jgi:hypothetical protein
MTRDEEERELLEIFGRLTDEQQVHFRRLGIRILNKPKRKPIAVKKTDVKSAKILSFKK